VHGTGRDRHRQGVGSRLGRTIGARRPAADIRCPVIAATQRPVVRQGLNSITTGTYPRRRSPTVHGIPNGTGTHHPEVGASSPALASGEAPSRVPLSLSGVIGRTGLKPDLQVVSLRRALKVLPFRFRIPRLLIVAPLQGVCHVFSEHLPEWHQRGARRSTVSSPADGIAV
jgi:hypothetical protein